MADEGSILWNNRIDLWGDPPYYDGVASAVITPGDLIMIDPANGQLKPHSAAAGAQAAALFALTNTVIGKGLEDTYAVGDTVYYCASKPGDQVQARIKVGATLHPGTRLESAGDGTLQVQTTGVAVAESMEDETVTGTPAHARVRIVAS
jgi:hypothetical protein